MKTNHYSSMKKLLLGSMILVPFVPFVLILAIGYYYFTGSLETNTVSSMKRIVGDHAQMIDSFLRERKTDLEFILRSYSYEDLTKEENLRPVFERLEKGSHAFVDLGVFNEEGIHVAYQGPFKLTGKIYKEAEWFREVMKRGAYMSDVFLGYRRIPHFVIALAREEGDRKWVIRATIDTYVFNDLVKKVRIGETGEAYIVNSEGIFQTERRSGGNLMDQDPDSIIFNAAPTGLKSFMKEDSRGVEYLYTTAWLKDKKWLLVVRQQKADALKAFRSAAYLIILITLIGGGAIIGVAFYLTDRIVRRMERMDEEKGRLGEQLIRATRLAELGEMAAGFAHEINNPLQIMKSEQALMDAIFTELKEKGELKPSEALTELEDSMRQVDLQINRCSEITQAILKFGRKTETVSKALDLRSFVPEVSNMVAKRAKVHGIDLRQEISEDTPHVHGDPGQLQQVLVNLLNNAIDAITAKHGSEGGELVIQAGPKENGQVEISVKDNGCGISEENLTKIFSPFFTTKPVGKGTGLGLSVCYGIIDKMGGSLQVQSEEGVGTTFTLSLPAEA